MRGMLPSGNTGIFGSMFVEKVGCVITLRECTWSEKCFLYSLCLNSFCLSPHYFIKPKWSQCHGVCYRCLSVCSRKAPTSRHRDWSVDVSPASWGCGLYCWVGGLQRSSVWVGFTYCSISGDPHKECLEAIVVFLSPHLGIQDCVPESYAEGISRWEPQSASAEPHWQHYLLRVPVHDPRAVWVW